MSVSETVSKQFIDLITARCFSSITTVPCPCFCEILLLKTPAKFQTCAQVPRDFLKFGTSLPFLDFYTNPLQIKYDILQGSKVLKRFKNAFNYI